MKKRMVKHQGSSGFILRASYILALIVFATSCYGFYVDQARENLRTDAIRNVSDSFASFHTRLLEFSKTAQRVAEKHQNASAQNYSDSMYLGMKLKDRKAFLAELPTDPEILSSKTALMFYRNQANKDYDKFLDAWRASGAELSAYLFQNARLVTIEDPFKHVNDLLDPAKIESARSEKDMFWVARQTTENFENLIVPTYQHIDNQLRVLLTERAARQGERLEKFLLIAIAVIGAIALFVFIPVDIFMQRLLSKLRVEQQRSAKAVERARNADRAKSEFLANMSHEIRTPMNGVMGMAELLAKTDLDSRQRTFTEIIVKSGASLLTIINDILDFSKIDAGQLTLDPAPFRLAEAIEDVATLISSRVAEKDLELIVRVDPAMPEMLVGDVGRIRQIFGNILGNAVKFTDNGHIFVNVTVVGDDTHFRNIDAESNLVFKIEVEDTGIGIPAEKSKAIFEKFSQVDGSATRKHEGSGLGLSIAASLVKMMDGTISVRSVPNQGSTFTVMMALPIEKSAIKPKSVPQDLSGSHILVVDDNEVNRSILLEQMAAWRFDSASASDGDEALAILKAASQNGVRVDCVILDYHMPEMNGGQVVAEIRRDPMLADLPIIMLTSVDQTEEGRTFSSLGIQAHLLKPARSSLLLETIIDVLTEFKARADSSDEASIGIMFAQQIGRSISVEPEDIVPEDKFLSYDIGNTMKQDTISRDFEVVGQDRPSLDNLLNFEVETVVEATMPVPSDETIDVLVCEDNEVNQIVFRQILEEAGFSFHVAKDGEEGLAAYKNKKPRLVLMDVSMPNVNGLEATAAIRAYEAEMQIKSVIIGVTAHAIKGDREKCLKSGMDDYLSKPVSPDVLYRKISSYLNEGQLALAN